MGSAPFTLHTLSLSCPGSVPSLCSRRFCFGPVPSVHGFVELRAQLGAALQVERGMSRVGWANALPGLCPRGTPPLRGCRRAQRSPTGNDPPSTGLPSCCALAGGTGAMLGSGCGPPLAWCGFAEVGAHGAHGADCPGVLGQLSGTAGPSCVGRAPGEPALARASDTGTALTRGDDWAGGQCGEGDLVLSSWPGSGPTHWNAPRC